MDSAVDRSFACNFRDHSSVCSINIKGLSSKRTRRMQMENGMQNWGLRNG